MRYSPSHQFFFVHIPKCAGSSVVRSLGGDAAFPREAVNADLSAVEHEPVPDAARDCIRHAALGNIHLAHLPLPHMKQHFPRTWNLLDRAESFTVIRDPRERFVSAVMQRLREFHGLSSSDLNERAVRREAAAVCDWLKERDRFCDLEYIHFTRQADYIFADGQQIVRHVFPVEGLDRMREWLDQRFGIVAEARHANPTVRPAGWFRPLAPAVMGVYKSVLPLSLRDRLTPYWRKSGLLKPVESHVAMALDPATDRFIEERYEQDTQLHRALS